MGKQGWTFLHRQPSYVPITTLTGRNQYSISITDILSLLFLFLNLMYLTLSLYAFLLSNISPIHSG